MEIQSVLNYFPWDCLQKVYLQIHLQGSAEGRTEQREKLTHNVIASEASVRPGESSEARMAFQSHSNDQQETGTLHTDMG